MDLFPEMPLNHAKAAKLRISRYSVADARNAACLMEPGSGPLRVVLTPRTPGRYQCFEAGFAGRSRFFQRVGEPISATPSAGCSGF